MVWLRKSLTGSNVRFDRCFWRCFSKPRRNRNRDACAELIRKNKHGFVVALGGGSALDAAKAAASVCMTNESISEYHGTGKALPKEHLPLIAVPTTAGTGSEVTKVSVVTNHANWKKKLQSTP